MYQNRGPGSFLPNQEPGYWTECTVDNPAVEGRGVERIVMGQEGEAYVSWITTGRSCAFDHRMKG